MAHLYTAIFRYDNGNPATGINPTVYIRDLTAGGTLVVDGGIASEAGGGWYYYSFADTEGHVYSVTFDAGSVSGLTSRYCDGASPGQYDSALATLQSNLTSAISLINSIVKVEYNSWEIQNPGVLIIYDNDGVTPIAQYLCYDINGNPTTSEIARVVKQ